MTKLSEPFGWVQLHEWHKTNFVTKESDRLTEADRKVGWTELPLYRETKPQAVEFVLGIEFSPELKAAIDKALADANADRETAAPEFLERLIENTFSWAMQDCNYLNPKTCAKLVEATRNGLKPEEAKDWSPTTPEEREKLREEMLSRQNADMKPQI